MTTNHKELCLGLRHMRSPRAERAADLIEQQAARIAELEKERDGLKADAERYRGLRDLLSGAVGAGIEVNDTRLVYEEPAPGKVVRLYWYPDTPIGFYETHGDDLDTAVDAALQAEKETRS